MKQLGLLCCLLNLASCGFLSQPHQATEDDEVATPSSQNALPPVSVAPFPLVQSIAEKGKADGSTSWRHYPLPGKKPTQYTYKRLDGRHSVMARATASASMLRQPVRVDPAMLGKLNFSWKVPELIADADLTLREKHDSPVRVVMVFDGDRSTFSMKNTMLSELAKTLTGEELPYATLMYVWCNACTSGTVLVNPRTDRIREIALETGPDKLNRWLDYQRDIRADYKKAFGEAPGALLDIGIMTDTDNTRQTAMAWYGPISLSQP